MRSKDEIQRAHDKFVAIITGEVANPFGECEEDSEIMHVLTATCDTLCWVLGHQYNTTFQENLDKIDRFFARSGVVESRVN